MSETRPVLERQLVAAEVRSSDRGRLMAFTLALLSLGLAALAFFVAENSVGGVAFLGMPVTLMVKAIVTGR